MCIVHKGVMCNGVVCDRSKLQFPKCLSMVEWESKLWYMQTVDESQPQESVNAGTPATGSSVGESHQQRAGQKNTYSVIPFLRSSQADKTVV